MYLFVHSVVMIILKYYNYASKKRHIMLILSCPSICAAKICAISTPLFLHLVDAQVEGGCTRSSLNDSRSSKDVGVGQVSGHVSGQEDVALTGNHRWDGSHDHTVLNAFSLDWDDIQARDKGGVEVTRWHDGWLNVDQGIFSSGLARHESKLWVCLDWQCHIGGWAGFDEVASDGINSVETERGAKDVGHWDLADSTTLRSLMESLRHQDRAGGSQIGFGGDISRSAEISRYAETFDD